ncbi:hypothetical protein ACL6C3_20590 [Capilliphycus salinus ALCB114379]|uniref:hypothetical protein n=1 Tax=Capilliphycus salinus TaxID=2768948 RepID=UPI0039A673DA
MNSKVLLKEVYKKVPMYRLFNRLWIHPHQIKGYGVSDLVCDYPQWGPGDDYQVWFDEKMTEFQVKTQWVENGENGENSTPLVRVLILLCDPVVEMNFMRYVDVALDSGDQFFVPMRLATESSLKTLEPTEGLEIHVLAEKTNNKILYPDEILAEINNSQWSMIWE